MNTLVLKSYYDKRGISRSETEIAVSALKECIIFLTEHNRTIENCSVAMMKEYIKLLIKNNENSSENLLALARSCYLAENREVYIYFTQIVERENIIENLRSHIEETIGKGKSDSIFETLTSPANGASPEAAYGYTKQLVEKLESELSADECRKALTANAHGIPPEAFQAEVEYFANATDLVSYLDNAHKRSVRTLQEHSDSGKVWFEQIITQPVVNYVKENKEVLGGILEDGKILWTKIPYDVEKWLFEKDPSIKRYYACHCPMAREILKNSDEKMPRSWCNCTSGYIQQRFNAIFRQKVQVDLLETVLDGDDRCRFAVHVPEEFL